MDFEKRLILALTLVMLPLVASVALTDFDYIGHGGGGSGSGSGGGTYEPAYDPDSVECDPDYFEPGPPPAGACEGGLVTSFYFSGAMNADGAMGIHLSPQDIKQLPWDVTDTDGDPWQYFLCNWPQNGGWGNCGPEPRGPTV